MASRCRPLLGTFVEVTAEREQAIEAAFAAVEKVHRLMSAHEPASDLGRINRFAHLEPVRVSEWTAEVLARAIHWARLSNGAFDVVRAGGKAVSRGALPLHEDQSVPTADADWRSIKLDGLVVTMDRPAALDLGGIAKGFAVDRAIDALRDCGAEHGLVNAGGDLRGFGPEPWTVAVVDPLNRRAAASVELHDNALATSAGLRTDQGRLAFDHLLGESVEWTSVSVLARNACDADALTKILWSATPRADTLLGEAGAKAFAIAAGGAIEPVGAELAAA